MWSMEELLTVAQERAGLATKVLNANSEEASHHRNEENAVLPCLKKRFDCRSQLANAAQSWHCVRGRFLGQMS